MNNTQNTQSNKNIKEEQKMENKVIKARFLANGDLSIALIHDGEKIVVKEPHAKFVDPKVQPFYKNGYMNNEWCYINCFTNKKITLDGTSACWSWGTFVTFFELLPNNKVMIVCIGLNSANKEGNIIFTQYVDRIFVLGNNHSVQYRSLNSSTPFVENVRFVKDTRKNAWSYSAVSLYRAKDIPDMMNAVFAHLGQPNNPAYHSWPHPYEIEKAYITYIRGRNGINHDDMSVEHRYQSLLTRPIVLPTEEQTTASKNSNLYAAIGERIGDTIMVTYKRGDYSSVTRIIINKNHFSRFSQSINDATVWNYESGPDLYVLKRLTIVNFSEEMVKGFPCERIARAKHFKEFVKEHVALLKYTRKKTFSSNTDKAVYESRIRNLIWACDSEECFQLMIGTTGQRVTQLFKDYGAGLQMQDVLENFFDHTDINGTSLNQTIGLNREQLKMVADLEATCRKLCPEYTNNRSYVKNALCTYREFVFKRWGQDLRPTSNADFKVWIDWAKERMARGNKNLLNFGWGWDRMIPASADRMALAKFWKNHNYNTTDIQMLFDLIHMTQTMEHRQQEPATMDELRIKDTEDLRRRHDRAVIAQKIMQNRIQMENWNAHKDTWDKYKFKDEEYQVVPPKDPEEIVTEGRVLDHCVGGYVDRVANGETIILFLRKKSDPAKPFYTLNIDSTGKKLIQVHGYKNRWPATDPEVIPFLDEWVKKFGFEGWDRIRTVNRDHY